MMYEDDIDAYYDEMARDAQYEAAREEWQAEQRESMREEQEALDEALRDAAREDCYADYSGGKGANMECTYHDSSPTTNNSWDNWTASLDGTFFGVSLVIVLTILFAILLLKPKKNK